MAPMSNDPQADALDRLYAKVTRRIVPLMVLGYIAAYLDRVNVGFAKLQMLGDLKFSETVSAPACSLSATSCSKCPAT
jgi:sugar phosphate permease